MQKSLELTEEELQKIQALKARNEGLKVQPEEFIVAEFGYYFGWGGVEAILLNKISLNDAMKLLQGARKTWNRQLLDIASVTYTASAAAQSGKKAKSVMQKGLRDYVKEARVDGN